MKFLKWAKDGGPESKVSGFFFVELKNLFSVALLRFDKGSREAFHSHAFNSVSWVLSGGLHEILFNAIGGNVYRPGWHPVVTRRSTNHKVVGLTESTWVLTFRGPWAKTWTEYIPGAGWRILTHGRNEL